MALRSVDRLRQIRHAIEVTIRMPKPIALRRRLMTTFVKSALTNDTNLAAPVIALALSLPPMHEERAHDAVDIAVAVIDAVLDNPAVTLDVEKFLRDMIVTQREVPPAPLILLIERIADHNILRKIDFASALAAAPFIVELCRQSALPSVASFPSIQQQSALCRLWRKCPSALPLSSVNYVRTELCVRWLACWPASAYHRNLHGENTSACADGECECAVVSFIGVNWSDAERYDGTVILVLETIFALLAGAPLHMEHQQYMQQITSLAPVQRPNFTIEPSPALAHLITRISLRYIERVPTYIHDFTTKFSGAQSTSACNASAEPLQPELRLYDCISRTMHWPLTASIFPWVNAILTGLCQARRTTLLSNITRRETETLIAQMTNVDTRDGALFILRRLLLGYQHSMDAFHDNLNSIITFTQRLIQDDIGGVSSSSAPRCIH